MKKHAFKPSYHCSLIKTNIIEKQSYCGVESKSKKCLDCEYRTNIDHSKDINPFKLVNEGNLRIDTGCKRAEVLNDILSNEALSASDIRIIKRNLKYTFY